jgi:hypothetical protein
VKGARRRRRIGQSADDVVRLEAPVRVEPERVHGRRRVVLVRKRPGHPEDPGGVRRRWVGAKRVRETSVRRLDLVARQRLRQRPIRMAVAARARADHDRRRRLELRKGGDGVFAVAVGPQRERALDGVAAAVPARARRASDVDVGAAAQRDRARRQTSQAIGPVEDPAHPLPVLEAVAQLEQLAASCGCGERGEKPGGGLVAGAGRGGHGDRS